MKTPFGKECKYFYGDYFRGKNFEECRLISKPGMSSRWNISYCKDCKIPGILLANECPNMTLNAEIKPGFLAMFKKVKVTAYCSKAHSEVKKTEIGCGLCHKVPDSINFK